MSKRSPFYKLLFKKKSFGLTVPELLIIIALIAALAVVFWMRGSEEHRAQARDSKRISEINTLRSALRLYHMDHGRYPLSTNEEGWCSIEGGMRPCPYLQEALQPYLDQIPGDVLFGQVDSGKFFSYQYISTDSGDNYKLRADLEIGDKYEVGGGISGMAIDYEPPGGEVGPTGLQILFDSVDPVPEQGSVELKVRISEPAPAGGVSVNYQTIDPLEGAIATFGDSCQEGVDYIYVADLLTWEEGQSYDDFKTIDIDVCPDTLNEDNESFRVELFEPVPSEAILSDPALITIVDDDEGWVIPPGAPNGQWPMFSHDARRTARNSNASFISSPRLKWFFQTYGGADSWTLIANDGTLYTSAGIRLYALNTDGTEKWSFWSWGCLLASPAVLDSQGNIYLFTSSMSPVYSELFVLDPADKSVIFEKDLDFTVGSNAPIIDSSGNLYIADTSGVLHVFDRYFNIKWEFDPPDGSPPGDVGKVVYSPAIGPDGTVYFGGRTHLYALNPDDGTEIWGQPYEVGSYIQTYPAIGPDGTIYITESLCCLHAVNPDGTQKWRQGLHNPPGYGHLAVGDDNTVYLNIAGYVLALDSNGTEKWHYEAPPSGSETNPAVTLDGSVYIHNYSSAASTFFAFDSNGNLKWEEGIGESGIGIGPVIADDGTVYAFGHSGYIYAYEEFEEEEEGWEIPSGTPYGQWPVFGHDKTNTSRNLSAPSIAGFEKWRVGSVGYIPTNWVLVAQDGTVIYTTGGQYLYGTKPDGSPKWETYKADYNFHAPGVIGADNNIYIIAEGSSELTVINASNGSIVVEIELPGLTNHEWSAPVIDSNGNFYIADGQGDLYVYNPDFTEKWHKDYSGNGAGSSAAFRPAIASDGTIYYGADDGKLYSYTPDGTENWSFPVGGGPINTSPVLSDDETTIYIQRYSYRLYAVNADGSEKWSYSPPVGCGAGDGNPALGPDGTVYMITCGGYMVAVNATGSTKWTQDTGGGGSIVPTPAVASDGTVYIGNWDSNDFYAFNPDGTVKWMKDNLDKAPRGSGAAIADDGTVYFPSAWGKIYAFGDWVIPPGGPSGQWPMLSHDFSHSAKNPAAPSNEGILKWAFPNDGWVDSWTLIADDGTVYTSGGSASRDFYALNTNGTIKWTFRSWGSPLGTPPVLDSQGNIYLFTTFMSHQYPELYILDPDSTVLFEKDLPYSIGYSAPVIDSEGDLYIFDRDNAVLHAFNRDLTLSAKWEKDFGDGDPNWWGNFSPAIGSDGTLYIGAPDQHLYALNPDDGSEVWDSPYDVGGDITTPAVVADDGTIYILEYFLGLHAVNPDGSFKWYHAPYTSSLKGYPVLGPDGTIYVNFGMYLEAVDPNDGSEKWKYQIIGASSYMTPAVALDGTIYIAEPWYLGPKFLALNPDGTLKWEREVVGSGTEGPGPAIANDGTVYVTTHDAINGGGYLYAFGSLEPADTDLTLEATYDVIGHINSSPAVHDIDQDDQKEIVVGDWYYESGDDYSGNIYVLRHDGSSITEETSYAVGGIYSAAPTIADVDGDGYLDVVGGTMNNDVYYLYNDYGDLELNTIKSLPGDDDILSSAVIGDVDRDGEREIILGSRNGTIYVFNNWGSLPIEAEHYMNYSYSSPAIVDSGGSYVDIYALAAPSYNRLLHHDGTSISVIEDENSVESTMATPAIGDVDGDGENEVVITGETLFVFNSTLDIEASYYLGNGLNPSAVIGDLDGDGTKEIVAADEEGIIYVFNHDGASLTKQAQYSSVGGLMWDASPALADVDSDGMIEIVFGDSFSGVDKGNLYVLSYNGTNLVEEEVYSLNKDVQSPPVIADVDEDGEVEIVVGDTGGRVYVFGTGGIAPQFKEDWPFFHHDLENTGNVHFQEGIDPEWD